MRCNRGTGQRGQECSAILTRRGLLKRAASVVAAAALPGQAGAAGEAISPVMAKLSAYMSDARDRALPDEVVEKAKHHVLDTFAAMISGSELPGGQAAIRFARAYRGEKTATVVASPVVCGPIEAALANGELAASDETDDAHDLVVAHLGSPIIPAALALGEQFGIHGMHLLRAVVLGYDVGPRVTLTLNAASSQRKGPDIQETHGIPGTFGAAAAAGCAASLNIQQMRWLLDYAAQQSSGISLLVYRDLEHVEKGFATAGMLARSGVTAALLIQSGWTGVDDIFSGPGNFFMEYAPQADPAGLTEKLGERYEVMRTMIKKYPTGAPAQAPLDALETLLKRHPFEPEHLKQITVRVATRPAYSVDNRDMPDINLQYQFAVMLIDKTFTFRAAHDKARMQDPTILRQRAKVQLIPDDELQRLMPRRVAIVDVTLTDGTHLNQRVDAVRGTPENPMSRDDVVAKARDLIAPVLGEAASANLIERALGLEKIKDIRELRPLLQRA